MVPAIIWAIDFDQTGASERSREDFDCEQVPADAFRWLHINLSNQASLDWIRASTLPAAMRELLLSIETHQRAQVEEGFIGCVLHDVERDFDRPDAERMGALRIVLGARLMITARHHPLRSADIVRDHITRNPRIVRAPADALDLIVSAIVESVSAIAAEHSRQIEAFEDVLLDQSATFDHRRLIHIRRRVVQFHRMLAGMRAVFARLEEDDGMEPGLLPTIEKLAQRLGAIDSDMISIQSQLRLLREEADLQMAQRTNHNLYVLSVLSALLLPATLVTGFFGMNTGGLPFAHGTSGTLLAGLIGLIASAGVYFLLRWMGMHRS